MNRSTTLLAERATELSELVGGMGWAGVDAGLDAVLAGAQDATVLDLVARGGKLIRLVEAFVARAAGEVARRSERELAEPLARRLGERSAAIAVAHIAGVPVSRAHDWCALGQKVTPASTLTGEMLPCRRPVVSAALDNGRLGVEEGRVILDALEKVEPFASVEEVAELEAVLVEQAAHLPVADLTALCRSLPDRFNPDGIEPREDQLRERSGVMISQRRDGLLRFIVDAHPEAAGFLTAALDARLAPRRKVVFADSEEEVVVPGDMRTLPQRRLDALVSIARDSLKTDTGDVSGTAVTMLVVVGEETLRTGVGAAHIDGVAEPISAATARRLACEADILPLVLGGDSQPLDLGRSRRLFSTAQRYAMAVRDGGCVWTGCNEPVSRCEAAHLEPWHRGGKTDLKNGVLLCRFHHRRLDNDGWAIRIENGIPYLIPPPWVDPTRTPRRAGKPAAA